MTQITLGAAVGELVLGRKLGNRAMLWGAVAGTIPDLDVLANVATDEMSALAYHRAFTHSLAYAAIAPFLLGPLAHRIYGGREGPLPASPWAALGVTWLALVILLGIGSWLMPIEVYRIPQIALTVGTATILLAAVILLRQVLRKNPHTERNVSWTSWAWLFFLGIVTHPLLDCCTTYGTQLFEPFSNTRIAWNNISVADPLYTLPFLACVIIAAFMRRQGKRRRWVNIAGIAWSLLYLTFTFVNKVQVDRLFVKSLAAEQVTASRYTTGPSILNNILWQGVGDADDTYYMGQYSILDANPEFELVSIAKGHDLLDAYPDNRDLRILRWFTNGYYSVVRRPDGKLQLNDLRFGTTDADIKNVQDFVFKFVLEEEQGELRAHQASEMPSNREAGEVMSKLWTRIKGKK